jgi:hypothetical protein
VVCETAGFVFCDLWLDGLDAKKSLQLNVFRFSPREAPSVAKTE